jgi:hypothetical protein
MTPREITEAAERVSANQKQNIQSDTQDFITLAVAYVAEKEERDLTFQVNSMARFEAAVMGYSDAGVWPDWVYEARKAVQRMREDYPAWLPDLLKILGWQGGTVYQAMKAVERLVEAEKDRERKAK